MNEKPKILITDDSEINRALLKEILGDGYDYLEAEDGAAAVELMRQRTDISLLLLDLMMPHLNGLEVLRQVTKRVPRTRVIILSMHAEEAYVLEALKGGAQGYVLKDANADELLHALREVVAGRRYLSPPLSDRAVAYYVEKAQETPLDPYETLTTREREVLALAAEGHSSADIAARLSISPRTAETHRAHLMQKLDLHNQTEVIRYALQRGVIS